MADFFRDELFCQKMNFCKKVQAFWLKLPELQGAPKIGLFSGQNFFGFDSEFFFALTSLVNMSTFFPLTNFNLRPLSL